MSDEAAEAAEGMMVGGLAFVSYSSRSTGLGNLAVSPGILVHCQVDKPSKKSWYSHNLGCGTRHSQGSLLPEAVSCCSRGCTSRGCHRSFLRCTRRVREAVTPELAAGAGAATTASFSGAKQGRYTLQMTTCGIDSIYFNI